MVKTISSQNGSAHVVLTVMAFLTLVLLVVFAYMYSSKNKQFQVTPGEKMVTLTEEKEPVPVTPEEKSTLLAVDGWKTFTSSYGFEFKYPSKLAADEQKIDGEKGFAYCIDFSKTLSWNFLARKVFAGAAGCYSKDFGAGGTSIDFEAARGGGFLDTQGFIFEDSAVTFKFTQTKSFEIPASLVKEVVTNKNGVEIVKVVGKNEKNDSPFPVMGTPGEGYIGAIINLHGTDLTGAAFQYSTETQILTEEEFNQILDTIKYTN